MRPLRYVCAQPAINYFTWQVEVMINNFMRNGVHPNYMDIVCSISVGEGVPEDWSKLANRYNMVRFFFYEDDRVNSPYQPSVRPNILKKHFKAHPYLKDEVIFYHDSDIVFTRPVNWSHYLEDDHWYCSDTISYIGTRYIKEKGDDIYTNMCRIVGIDESIPLEQETGAGGAQYIMKNIDHTFWEKVEHDCDALYQYFVDRRLEYPDIHPDIEIQAWTADMWAVLWNGWLRGAKSFCPSDMEFAWANGSKEQWDNCAIYHNAGALRGDEHLFYKGAYVGNLPYDITNTYNSNLATYYYVEEIVATAKITCLR